MCVCVCASLCTETAMGIKVNAQLNPNSQYVKDIHSFGMITVGRMFNPLHYSDFIFSLSHDGMHCKNILKRLHSFTDQVSLISLSSSPCVSECVRVSTQHHLSCSSLSLSLSRAQVIKQRREEILLQQTCEKDANENNIHLSNHNDSLRAHVKKPFMDTLIEEHLKNPSAMTLRDIREEVDTFMFEGKESRITCHVKYVYIARVLTHRAPLMYLYPSFVDSLPLSLLHCRPRHNSMGCCLGNILGGTACSRAKENH